MSKGMIVVKGTQIFLNETLGESFYLKESGKLDQLKNNQALRYRVSLVVFRHLKAYEVLRQRGFLNMSGSPLRDPLDECIGMTKIPEPLTVHEAVNFSNSRKVGKAGLGYTITKVLT